MYSRAAFNGIVHVHVTAREGHYKWNKTVCNGEHMSCGMYVIRVHTSYTYACQQIYMEWIACILSYIVTCQNMCSRLLAY